MRRYVVATPSSASSSAISTAAASERSTSWRRKRSRGFGPPPEGGNGVPAGRRRLEQLPVVAEVERAAHRRQSTHWKVASPSGSRKVTTPSYRCSNPASTTGLLFGARRWLQK